MGADNGVGVRFPMENLSERDVENLFDAFDNNAGIVYVDSAQEYQAHEYLAEMVEDMASGHFIQDSEAFWDLLDYLDLEYADFPWEDFGDWYDNL